MSEVREREALPDGWAPRSYRAGDEDPIVDVLSSAFERWPKVATSASPREHLEWKLDSHPDARRLSLVAEVDNRVVGWQGYWLQSMLVEGEVILAKQALDYCVHTDYQQIGIRTKMRVVARNHPRRNFQMNFGLSSGHPAERRIQRIDGRPGRRLLANGVEALEWRSDGAQPDRSTGDWTLRRVSRFDDRSDRFWQEARKPFVLIVERKAEYLNWRYADPRAGTFQITIAEAGDDVVGYVVATASRDRGYIADLLALPGRTDVVRSLLGHAVDELAGEGKAAIECWLPREHPYRGVLEAQGFVHKRRSIDVSARAAREYAQTHEMAFGADPKAAIHIALGDFDLV